MGMHMTQLSNFVYQVVGRVFLAGIMVVRCSSRREMIDGD